LQSTKHVLQRNIHISLSPLFEISSGSWFLLRSLNGWSEECEQNSGCLRTTEDIAKTPNKQVQRQYESFWLGQVCVRVLLGRYVVIQECRILFKTRGLRDQYLSEAQNAAKTVVFPGKLLRQNRKLACFKREWHTVWIWGNRQICKEWPLLCASSSFGVVRE